MTAFIIGLGESGKDWVNHPCDVSIGVNDALKWGKDTDHLVLIDSLNGFKKEPERVKTISRSKAKILTHGDTWKKIFPKYEVLRLQGFSKHLNRKHVYSSKSSPFVALSYAFNLGAENIIMWGVDMNNHQIFHPGTKLQDYEIMHFYRITSLMKQQGTNVFISSEESQLSRCLPVWKGSGERPRYHFETGGHEMTINW